MSKRKAIPAALKIKCLIHRTEIKCGLCGEVLTIADKIEWDHIWPIAGGGPQDDPTNLRPIHYTCHKRKSAKDVAGFAKVKRIRKAAAGNYTEHQKRISDAMKTWWAKRSGKIPSRPFQKRAKP